MGSNAGLNREAKNENSQLA